MKWKRTGATDGELAATSAGKAARKRAIANSMSCSGGILRNAEIIETAAAATGGSGVAVGGGAGIASNDGKIPACAVGSLELGAGSVGGAMSGGATVCATCATLLCVVTACATWATSD